MGRHFLGWIDSRDGNGGLPSVNRKNTQNELPKIGARAGKLPEQKMQSPSTKAKVQHNSTQTKHNGARKFTLKFPFWVLMIMIVGAGSLTMGMPTLASFDIASIGPTSPEVNLDSTTFVVSRVRFDPTSDINMDGVTAMGATAVFTQIVKANFLSEMGDIVTISGIRVQNLGTTNAIAAVEVIAPQGVAVDVRSPPGAGNELRLLGTNTFALPIDAGTTTSPGSAEIELRLIILTGPLDPGQSQQFSIQIGIFALD